MDFIMIARMHKRLREDEGFTLVELLVVIIIIGILAAVAVPLYMNQQNQAKDSAAKSDLGNLKVALASALVSTPNATSFNLGPKDSDATTADVEIAWSDGVKGTDGVAAPATSLTILPGSNTYCYAVKSASGKDFSLNQEGKIFESADCK